MLVFSIWLLETSRYKDEAPKLGRTDRIACDHNVDRLLMLHISQSTLRHGEAESGDGTHEIEMESTKRSCLEETQLRLGKEHLQPGMIQGGL